MYDPILTSIDELISIIKEEEKRELEEAKIPRKYHIPTRTELLNIHIAFIKTLLMM